MVLETVLSKSKSKSIIISNRLDILPSFRGEHTKQTERDDARVAIIADVHGTVVSWTGGVCTFVQFWG